MEESSVAPSSTQLYVRGLIMAAVTISVGVLTNMAGFTFHQVLSSSIFMMIISATLLFWQFRLAIAFVGIATLLGCGVLDLEGFINSCELEIILFLVGMMVTVGVLKELGLFTWVIQMVIGMKGMNGRRFVTIIVFLSAIMACTVDEVTSIVFVSALVFQVCDTLKLKPKPFVMIAVLATNIGSSGTMLGNPVGILIGQKAGFTFGEFLMWSAPVAFVSLTVALFIVLFWYRKDIAELSEKLETRRDEGLGLGPLVEVPYLKGLLILTGLIGLIASHSVLEESLGIAKNTVLIVAPLFVAGLLMIWRYQRGRHYIETEVEWWTLLFFMMLFAVAGTLDHTGVTKRIATDFSSAFAGNPVVLTPVIVFLSAIGSAFVDNVVFVAAFIPVVRELDMDVYWWALLMGACFGGNITMIGSTANIVVLGLLEKRYRIHVNFLEWLKIGSVVGLTTCCIACVSLYFMRPYIERPPEEKPKAAQHGEVNDAHGAGHGDQDGQGH